LDKYFFSDLNWQLVTFSGVFMGIPLLQAARVGAYIMKQKVLRREKYPLVLMLEPLFTCNLSCNGCGKTQYPAEVLKKRLTPEECWAAAAECGAPIVSIAGGEPLLHPEIDAIVKGFIRRRKFVYLCTNGILLERSLDRFKPNGYFTWNVHLDGPAAVHDRIVGRPGTFDAAVSAMKAAKSRGFRLTANTTVFDGVSPEEMRAFFDLVTDEVRVDGITIAPGFAYEKAPDRGLFLVREKTHRYFKELFKGRDKKKWVFNHSPMYLEFLEGKHEDWNCTPWGNPCRNVLGWQRPCYLLADGCAATFKELMDKTDWSRCGRGGDARCDNCMAHCGFEPTAVIKQTSSLKNMLAAAKTI
jgi:hopanoid biosynthesis associated radical SAM protein HpnH